MDTRSRSPTAKWLDPNRWAPHRFKTDMCKFHQEGKCKRGDACKYAHAESELHDVGGKLRGGKRREYELGERNPSSKPRASSAAASSSGGLVSAPAPDSDNPVEGTIVGDAVCIGKASNFGPTIWIGSNVDADDACFLDKYKITVVVRCKDGYPWSTIRTSRPIVWVNASCWDSTPGTFPFVEQNGIASEDLFNSALVNMCSQIDGHVGKGNVLFHCHRGRHRSFAGAVAYVMWSVRSVRFEQVNEFICSLHRRFHMREEPTVIKGRERRSLSMELVAWEAFLRRHRPQSVLREIPPKFTPARE